MTKPSPLLIALSGPTSSGKTSIATALSSIFSDSLVIHEDDFYKPDSQIPLNKGLQDWDCAEALDLQRFAKVLQRLERGQLDGGLEGLVTQGNYEADGVHGVQAIGEGLLDQLRKEVEAWPFALKRRKIVIVDGFLLFGKSVRGQLVPPHSDASSTLKPRQDIFHIRILLRASYQDAKSRRQARNGYVTLEGFWQDPPAYFDDIVWPNFVEEHSHLFDHGDVERGARRVSDADEKIFLGPVKPEGGLETVLRWVVETLRDEINTLSETE